MSARQNGGEVAKTADIGEFLQFLDGTVRGHAAVLDGNLILLVALFVPGLLGAVVLLRIVFRIGKRSPGNFVIFVTPVLPRGNQEVHQVVPRTSAAVRILDLDLQLLKDAALREDRLPAHRIVLVLVLAEAVDVDLLRRAFKHELDGHCRRLDIIRLLVVILDRAV